MRFFFLPVSLRYLFVSFFLQFLAVSGETESPVFFEFFFFVSHCFFCARLSHLVMTSLTRWRHVTPANEWSFLWERNPICLGKETVVQPNANDEDFIKKKASSEASAV